VSDLNFSDFPVSRIWRGRNYPEARIFILGESWYGEYLGDLNYDDGYIAAYLEGRQVDRMYSKMANAVGMSKATFWHSVAFTNFVQCVGPTRQSRPTPAMYSAAAPRLKAILNDISPAAVWVLGIEQSALSIPIIQAAAIPAEVCIHPTSIGVTSAALRESWERLRAKVAANGAALQ
jgi:hypothetical protein